MSDMGAATAEKPRDRPITVDEYHRMGEIGILGAGERLQLVSGRIIEMPPPGPPHASRVTRLDAFLQERFRGRAVVRSQQPIILDSYSEPEPDIVLARGPEDRYDTAHPTPADVLLLIEVSDSTLSTDRGAKLAAYARSRVLEYWIVNLRDCVVEVYAEPEGGEFRTRCIARAGERVSPRAFPNDEIDVSAIVGLPAT